MNLSESGALLQTRCRLAPGGVVELHWGAGGRREVTRAHVVRCAVAVVHADTILYRGAVRFERELRWGALQSGGQNLPVAR